MYINQHRYPPGVGASVDNALGVMGVAIGVIATSKLGIQGISHINGMQTTLKTEESMNWLC